MRWLVYYSKSKLGYILQRDFVLYNNFVLYNIISTGEDTNSIALLRSGSAMEWPKPVRFNLWHPATKTSFPKARPRNSFGLLDSSAIHRLWITHKIGYSRKF